MKWLTNISDPKKYPAPRKADETQNDANKYRDLWLANKTIGRPQSTPLHSVEELESFGMVGVYAPEQAQRQAQR